VVDDRDIRHRFGIDQYFQIDMFVPLGNQVVRLGRPDNAKESPTFSNTYPVTVCVSVLPPGLSEGELQQEMRIPAVHFKLWAYRSQFVASYDSRQLQISPMLIGRQPVLIHRDRSSSPYSGLGLASLFLIVLIGIWIWSWRFQRQDAVFSKQTRQRRFSAQTDKSLDELGAHVPDQPDFSNLLESEREEPKHLD
jgi:hypothetical protein